MKTRDMMRASPLSCGPSTSLDAAVEMLRRGKCGALPVVDANAKVVGMITDRDICVALGAGNRRPSEVTAQETMSRPAATCNASEDIHEALKTMSARKVRRLPVVDDSGRLEGILSLSDLILEARHDDGSRPDLTYEDVVHVLQSIYWAHSVTCRTDDLACPN